MSNPFKIVRWWAYALCLVSAVCVLGIMAHQASVFIDNPADKPYVIYLLVTASLTIAILALVTLRSQPRIDVFVIAVLCILWLAAGSYTADRIGHVDCEDLRGTRRPAKNGDADAQMWCRELKAVMAFSFFDFGLLLVSLVILITLILRLYSRGEREIWERSMTDIYTYGPHPGMHTVHATPGPTYTGNVVYQRPGHDVVIENGEVRQVPTGTY